MKTVKVTGTRAKFIPGIGERQPGETFDLPDRVATALSENGDFELVQPQAASKPEPKSSEVETDD